MRAVLAFLVAVMLGLSGCTKEGTVYAAPVDQVYGKLAALDMGADIGSAVFRYYDESLPVETEANRTVKWHMGKNGKGTDVIAHLIDEGGGKTRVFVEVVTPDMGQMALFKGFAANMIRERIAAHLEERPYDDQKFVDAMYGGNASLVPKEMREAGTAALKMEADMKREQREAENRPQPAPPQGERVQWGKPVGAATN